MTALTILLWMIAPLGAILFCLAQFPPRYRFSRDWWNFAWLALGALVASGLIYPAWTTHPLLGAAQALLSYNAVAWLIIAVVHPLWLARLRRGLAVASQVAAGLLTVMVIPWLVVFDRPSPGLDPLNGPRPEDLGDRIAESAEAIESTLDSFSQSLKHERERVDQALETMLSAADERKIELEALRDQRDALKQEVDHLERLRDLSTDEIATIREELHRDKLGDYIVGFFVGIASGLCVIALGRFFRGLNAGA